MFKKPDSSVRLFSYDDDQPREAKGSLIPSRSFSNPNSSTTSFIPNSVRSAHFTSTKTKSLGFAILAIFAFVLVNISSPGLFRQMELMAAPIVTISDGSNTVSEMEFGPEESLNNKTIFTQTRDAFIEEGFDFIEVDISNRLLRFFENGVLIQSAEILAVGEKNSWWETPSGLYKVEKKDEEIFSTTGQVYLPWRLAFQGNYVIHGWPYFPDGVPVGSDYKGGGIRISDESAQALYKHAKNGMPVLVHSADTNPDKFVYKPQVLDVTAKHYFIADIDNSTILAASDLDEKAAIASLVKLMTAVVATEEMSVDRKVRVASPNFVTSLIPRLSGRSTVYMYNLLQLLLVESSNEAAETIAGELGREEFIEAMNAKARQLGMFDTNFADPSGLSSDNISSLNDLYNLTKYIHEDKNFIFEITANEAAPTAYSGGEFEDMINFNEIEGMESFVGGKVGETLAAGQTSISLHKLRISGEDRILVIILLGSTDRTKDVETMVSYVQNRYAR